MSVLLVAIEKVMEPLSIALLVGGSFIGVTVGAIPGLNSAIIIALILPLTITLNPFHAFIGLVSLYCGSIFGGSISAILINVPGTPEACATAFDGYKLTQKGLAGKALGGAIVSSFLGGFTSVFFLMFLSPFLAKVALVFGPAEYFALGILGVSAVIGLSTQSQLKGLFSGFFGLLTATVGTDMMTGYSRFTFGIDALDAGINFIPMIIGLFAVNELLTKCGTIKVWKDPDVNMSIAAKFPSFSEFWSLRWLLVGCILLGVIVGIVPGTGATIAAFLAYSLAAQFSRHGQEFGTGTLAGVVAPESANNATTGGAMIPLLSLGIPGSGTTAVLLAAFIVHGLTPGPILFVKHPDLIYSIFLSMLLANILLLPVGLVGVKAFAHVARIKYRILGPILILVCSTGSYAVTNDIFGVWTMFIFGIIGFLLTKYSIPLSPMILGAILGSLIEQNYHRTLSITGNVLGIFERPIPCSIFFFLFIIFSYPIILSFIRKRKGSRPKQKSYGGVSDLGWGVSERIQSILFYSISLLVWLFLLFKVYGFSQAKAYEGVGIWPSIILICLIILTVSIIIMGIRELSANKSRIPAENKTNIEMGRFFGGIGIFILYLLLLPALGFSIASFIFIISLMILLGERRTNVLSLVGITSTIIVYIIFAKFLGVWFPKGIGIFRTITEILS